VMLRRVLPRGDRGEALCGAMGGRAVGSRGERRWTSETSRAGDRDSGDDSSDGLASGGLMPLLARVAEIDT
jgi:hypothetical protein